MTREEFDAHVQKIERRYGQRPTALRIKLVGLAAIGYTGLLMWLFAASVIGAAFIALAMSMDVSEGLFFYGLGALFLLIGGVMGIRALWVELKPPEGRVVNRTETPVLHAMMDELQRSLGAASFHRVTISYACNAAVYEVPRLGLLGWPRHYLELGLPLLESLSVDEVRAVLAHEYAHLSSRHGRLGAWLYRLRRSWDQIFEKLRQPYTRSLISWRPVLIKFVDWFWPRFNAHAFVLSRLNEFQADAIAASIAGRDAAASALYRIDVYDRLLSEHFWPTLWQRANAEPNPPEAMLPALRDSLIAGPSPEDSTKWRLEAFRFVTSNSDTHPCLSARLRAIHLLPEGVEAGRLPPWPEMRGPSAAEALFGALLPKIREDVDSQWRQTCRASWIERHQRAHSLRHQLETLNRAVPTTLADADHLWDQAKAVIKLQDDAAAVELLQQILMRRPNHPGANFCLGRHLLSTGNEAGIAHLEKAMEGDEDLVAGACDLLHNYYRRTGRLDMMKEIERRLDRVDASRQAAQAELGTLTASDTMEEHGLNPTELGQLQVLLAADPSIHAAYLGQKRMKYSRKQRLFGLCIEVKKAWHRLPDRDREQQAVSRLVGKVQLPGRVLIFAPTGSFASIAAKIRRIPSAKIHPRPGMPV